MVLGIVYARFWGEWSLQDFYFLILLGLVNGLLWFKQKLVPGHWLAMVQVLFLVFFGKVQTNYFLQRAETDKKYQSAEAVFHQIKINSLVETRPKVWKATAIILGTNTQCLTYFQKTDSTIKPAYGDVFAVKARFEPIEKPLNPAQFDYAGYLHLQGTHLRTYLTANNSVKIKHAPDNLLLNLAFNLNQKGSAILEKYVKDTQELAVLNAMILGVRSELDPDLVQAYSAAGAIHVLSVSGLHVGVIMVVLSFLLGPIRRFPSFGKYAYLAILLGIMWLYALVTGFSAPVLRSTIMFSVIAVAQVVAKKHYAINTLAFSAFWLLVWQPTMLFQIGFLLSYLAIVGMVIIQPLLNPLVKIDKFKSLGHRALDRLWKVSTVAVAAQVATLPITIYYFHQFPNYFLLVNPIVILLSSVVLILGLGFVLFAAVFPANIFSELLVWLLTQCTTALNNTVLKTEALPGAIADYLHLGITEVLLLYALILLLLLYFYYPNKKLLYASIVLALPIVGLKIVHTVNSQKREQLVIYHLPKSVAMSYQKGTRLQLFAADSILNNKALRNFTFKNHWASMGVEQVENQSISSQNSMLKLGNKKLLVLHFSVKALPQKVIADYVVLTSKKIRFETVKDLVSAKTQIVLAGNFTDYYQQKFMEDAAADTTRIHSLKHDGAIVLTNFQ
jgi:competence protein ComEC